MNYVVAQSADCSGQSNQHSTQESAQHATTRFSTPAYTCWGERIRTSDWLIQNQNTAKGRQNWVLTRDGGQANPGYGCGICIERKGKSEIFPSAWDVEQHIKDDHFGRKAPK